MAPIDIALLAMIAAVALAIAYLLMHSFRPAPRGNPYAEFDYWQQTFHDGIQSAHLCLDREDNPYREGTPDFDAWEEGWELAMSHIARGQA